MGIIEHAGYNMSKHGVLALTKAFPHSEPAVYDSEGIKCYGLAPWFTDTNLVRESTIGSWDYRGKRVDSMQALQEATKLRVLNATEVGHALLKAFQYDKVNAMGIYFEICLEFVLCLRMARFTPLCLMLL